MPDTIHVHHILVRHEYEAQDLLKKIQSGSDFSELAKIHSTCPSSARGGDLGAVDPKRFVQEFAEAAVALNAGEVSGPVQTRFGYHLIKRV